MPAADRKDAKGLYSTLGVTHDADVADIRKAYRRLALRWHPDKNPDDPSATEQFQKISSSYEVLSDADKRELYDTTGCIDAEELEGDGPDFESAADLFAAFFSMHTEELDEDEQMFLDELLSAAGSNPFKRGRGRPRGKKGRRGKGGGGGRRAADDDVLEQVFMAMAGMDDAPPPGVATCPEGHDLKRRKAQSAEYECDVCAKDIVEGKRFFDCRKCDWSMCQKCHKQREAEILQEDEDDIDHSELLEAFCELHTTAVRKGRRLQFKCDICDELLERAETVMFHMTDNHMDALEAFLEEAAVHSSSMPFGMPDMLGEDDDDLEELMMGMLAGGMMPGLMPEMLSGGPRAQASSGSGRHKNPRSRKRH